MLGYDSEKKDGSDTSVVPADAPIYMADKEAAVAGLPDGVNGVFGREDEHDIKYGKLTWGAVAVLMIVRCSLLLEGFAQRQCRPRSSRTACFRYHRPMPSLASCRRRS